ncbi:hypothetical protein CA85_15970 [Allorhodopirellula solitaria]|uniref:Uncharacterized protein n=2 Tax=Allorhodopirellula solitaria TaxID=2527987 RepID=A0A5C5YCM3_9BACT|nr:hypothetical protein CA85_15970 [Allorhodopirellula solitaria]
MVQIDAPKSGSPEAATPIAPAPTQSAAESPHPPMVVGSDAVDSQEITQGDLFSEEEIDPGHGSRQANGGFATPEPPVAPGASRPEFTVDSPPAHDSGVSEDWQGTANWTSEPTRKFRQRLLIAIATAGTLLIVAVFVMWLISDSPPDQTLAPTVAENTPAAQNPNPEALATEPDRVAESEPVPDMSESDSNDSGNVSSPQSEPAEPIDSEVEDETAPASEQVPAGGSPEIPSDLLPVDVLGGDRSDPADRPARNGDSVVSGQTDEPAADPLTDLPPELASFVDLLNLPGDAPDAPPVRTPEVPVADLIIDQAADAMLDPMLLATPPPEVNIDNALKLRVAVQSDGYPLAGMVLVFSELTQVPIQLDWFTFDLMGISMSQKVRDATPGWKPVGTLMDAIASDSGVVFEQEEARLFLTASPEDARESLRAVLATDDFGSEQESAESLAERFASNPLWNEREQLNLKALATDCLRLARGLPSKLPEPALAHWTVRAEGLLLKKDSDSDQPERLAEQWPLLEGGKSGSQLDTAITLAGLLRRTSRLNGATCVVNWDDARQRRLTPGQLVLPYADQPAGEMLAETLAPLGLQTRMADPSHWWVGTAATYDRMPLLVIGDELGPQRDQILQRIRDAAEHADTLIFIEHDPVSDRYLAMLPRFLYRQLPAILHPFSQ